MAIDALRDPLPDLCFDPCHSANADFDSSRKTGPRSSGWTQGYSFAVGVVGDLIAKNIE